VVVRRGFGERDGGGTARADPCGGGAPARAPDAPWPCPGGGQQPAAAV